MELIQKLTQRLSQQQLQSIGLLQMSTQELEEYLRDLSSENPLIEINEEYPEMPMPEKKEYISPSDFYEDRYYYPTANNNEDEGYDPLEHIATSGGFEETLEHFIFRQLERLDLPSDLLRTARYIAACLDDDGYMRFKIEELSEQTGVPAVNLQQALSLIKSLEPAGVGASSLAECLELQLLAVGYSGPALSIVRSHLGSLAKHRYQSIAAKLSVSVSEVRKAETIIRQLEPRPAAIFNRYEQPQYIRPDLIVLEENGRFIVHSVSGNRKYFNINNYYCSLIDKTDDEATKEYLTAKLNQAKSVSYAVDHRESTLMRCAAFIVNHQQNFFRFGKAALIPLGMAEVADSLGVHESTISRAVREKYLQCHFGLFPLRFFFIRSIPGGTEQNINIGIHEVKSMIKQLIEAEDKSKPLSDQKICDIIFQKGYPVSRRTVAKYRDELDIPSAHARKNI